MEHIDKQIKMEHIDLSMGIPLLIQDQNETVVYMDNSDIETDTESVIFKNSDETLIVNENNTALLINNHIIDETITTEKVTENETLIISHESANDDILIEKDDENLAINDFLSKTDVNNIYNEMLTTDQVDKHDIKGDNSILIQNFEGSPVCLNGQMVQLLDGSTAFIENSKNSENEIYTPIKLYNGSVIYVVAGTLLNTICSAETVSTCESTDRSDGTDTMEIKTEKSKGFQCSYKNCNKSYSSYHHLKVSKTEMNQYLGFNFTFDQ